MFCLWRLNQPLSGF